MRPQKLYKSAYSAEALQREEALKVLSEFKQLEEEAKSTMNYAKFANGTIIGSTNSERLNEYIKKHKRQIIIW